MSIIFTKIKIYSLTNSTKLRILHFFKRQWERKELVSHTDMKSIRLTDFSKYNILNMTL